VPAGPPIIAAVFAWLHLLAFGVAAGLLLTEYWLCRRMPDRIQVRLLGMVDLGYLLALIASLATGLARALYYGQEPAYYLANRLFWLKIAIYLVVVLVATAPTLQYIRWNREARTAPSFAPLTREVERVRASIAFGLGLWLILPLLAILVVRGYGLP
jgi:putative membrane protein